MSALNRRNLLIKTGRLILGAWVFATMPLSAVSRAGSPVDEIRGLIKPLDINKLKITVGYDNNPYDGKLSAAWGFSCLVEGLGRTVLFDTGGDDKVLLSNLTALGVSPDNVDLIMLSHEHWDHILGLFRFLEMKSGLKVYVPASFSRTFKEQVVKLGSRPIEVSDPVRLTENCFSSGEMESYIRNEQALIIDTTAGLVVITGCAHPGVVDMAARAKKLMQKDLLLVMGGFHLRNAGQGYIRKIISRLQALGVRYVAPTHCTGDKARKAFTRAYGGNCVDCGAGRIITGRDLTATPS